MKNSFGKQIICFVQYTFCNLIHFNQTLILCLRLEYFCILALSVGQSFYVNEKDQRFLNYLTFSLYFQ